MENPVINTLCIVLLMVIIVSLFIERILEPIVLKRCLKLADELIDLYKKGEAIDGKLVQKQHEYILALKKQNKVLKEALEQKGGK